MHRIDTPGSVDGAFQPGDPGAGTAATQLGADWLNDVQENVARVVEHAGIALAKGDGEQLYEAIQSMRPETLAHRGAANRLWVRGAAGGLAVRQLAVEVAGGVAKAEARLTKAAPALPAHAWAYVMARLPAGGAALAEADIEITATPPTDNASAGGWYDATGDWRMISLARTDGAGALLPWQQVGTWWMCHQDLNFFGPATGATSVPALLYTGAPDLGELVVRVRGEIYHPTDERALWVRKPGTTLESKICSCDEASTAVGFRDVGTDSEQRIEYRAGSAGATVTLDLLGFHVPL